MWYEGPTPKGKSSQPLEMSLLHLGPDKTFHSPLFTLPKGTHHLPFSLHKASKHSLESMNSDK